jgi:hypothetical protein
VSRSCTILCLSLFFGGSVFAEAKWAKPRLIVLTDRADEDEFRNLFLYANEFDLEGLIATTSVSRPTRLPIESIAQQLKLYQAMRPQLAVHAEGYPMADAFGVMVAEGVAGNAGGLGVGMKAVGKGRATSGSNHIIQRVDREDARPVWIAIWGGANTLAQSLYEVRRTRSMREVAKFVSRLRVYDLGGQDEAGAWICKNFPSIRYYRSTDQFLAMQKTAGKHATSISYLHLVHNGFNEPEQMSWGGWGGRFGPKRSVNLKALGKRIEQGPFEPFKMFTGAADRFETTAKTVQSVGASLTRWRLAIHRDRDARAIWATQKEFKKANHPPKIVMKDATGIASRRIATAAGHQIDLDASASTDPDGDKLTYRWFYYPEAGTFTEEFPMQNAGTAHVRFATPGLEIPADAHIILEVTDDGTPALTSYRRIIVEIIPD